MSIDGIQSVDRSLEILRIVAERGKVTATELAGMLGIHQSSASRHLKSLYDAGYVRKPDFHSFAPGYGILLFAGTAMKAFPLVGRAADICSGISAKHGVGAAVAVLVKGRLVYLAWISHGDKKSFNLVDDSNFPVFKSSLGLLLSYLDDSINLRKSLLNANARPEAEKLFKHVDFQMKENGFVYFKDFHVNKFNAAIGFEAPDGSGNAALAVFSTDRLLDEKESGMILKESVSNIRKGVL